MNELQKLIELERLMRIEAAAKLLLAEDEKRPSTNQYILDLENAVERDGMKFISLKILPYFDTYRYEIILMNGAEMWKADGTTPTWQMALDAALAYAAEHGVGE